jgi:glycosyl transferase, family 25
MQKQAIKSQKLPIWILNMERSIERRAFMEEQFSRLNLEYEIIAAVDGLKLTNNELSRYSKKDAMRCSERELSPGEIGCVLSHARMWQRIVDEDLKQVLIFEDDVLIGEMLIRILDDLCKLPPDWEFINFVTDAGKVTFGDPICDIHRVCNFNYYPNRLGAYLINKSGAQKLLKEVYPVRWTADGLTGFSYITGLVTYGIEPEVVALRKCNSDIYMDNRHFTIQRSFKAKLRTIFRKFINGQEFVFNKFFKIQK